MKLYKEVLIESAEQAEALPVGTVARSHGSDGEPTHACLRMANGWWCTDETNDDGTPFLVPHVGMVRDMALVPIEAEEETRVTPEALAAAAQQTLARANRAAATGMLPPDRLTIQQQTRYVTRWTPASE